MRGAVFAAALLAAAPAAAQTPTALVDCVPVRPLDVAPEVSWYRIDRDGAAVGMARFEYSLAAPARVEFKGEVEQAQGGALQVQRSSWIFDGRLRLVSFEEVLESGGERRALRGEVKDGVVREVFEIPGLPPRTLECAVPENAIARYAANLLLLESQNLRDGAAYGYRQLSPRSGQFASVVTKVKRAEGAIFLETTSDEVPGLVVRSEVLPRSPEHPNGCTVRSLQEAPGFKLAIVKVSEAEAHDALRAARERR